MMANMANMARARDMLQLRVRHAATPARVARAATMFNDALKALGAADEVGTTLIIANKDLVATLRTRSKSGASAVGTIIQIVQNPITMPSQPGRAEIAAALARYAHDEGRYHPQLWLPRHDKPLCNLDETFASLMEALANAPEVGSHKARGTTYVYSKILRVGRIDERHECRVRVVVDGRPRDLSIGGLAVAPFFDAAKRDVLVRLKLQAEWTQSPGQPPCLLDASILGIEEVTPGSGARILALAKEYNVITVDDLPDVQAAIERQRSGE
jgi:hypothetical protein